MRHGTMQLHDVVSLTDEEEDHVMARVLLDLTQPCSRVGERFPIRHVVREQESCVWIRKASRVLLTIDGACI
jgi:hypothetical protein